MVPKFRAYDTKNKVMVTNLQKSRMKIETGKVLYQLTTTNENEIKAIASYNTFDDYIYRYSHDLELMQSTGLKDKNGVEVFQGDVVVHEEGEYSYKGIVLKGKYYFYIEGVNINDSFSFDDISNTLIGEADFEVIGNIYENPELLEPANEN